VLHLNERIEVAHLAHCDAPLRLAVGFSYLMRRRAAVCTRKPLPLYANVCCAVLGRQVTRCSKPFVLRYAHEALGA
jgi:hypothetical protein